MAFQFARAGRYSLSMSASSLSQRVLAFCLNIRDFAEADLPPENSSSKEGPLA